MFVKDLDFFPIKVDTLVKEICLVLQVLNIDKYLYNMPKNKLIVGVGKSQKCSKTIRWPLNGCDWSALITN